MANPFSGFLTPPQQTSALAGAPNYALALSERQRGYNQDQQRKLENEQQNTRANARLGMEQAYQTRKFSQEDQKQVEALLAEYQDAEDQGDPVRLSRAAQMLQRFGMNVGQPAKPDLRAFTGEQSLPSVPKAQPTPETLQALTGSPAAPAQDLSQEDFESQLIAGSGQLPERMEQGGQSTEAMRAATSSPDEPVDMGDVDSPEFKQAAAAEGATAGESQPAQSPKRLATQLLPTVVSKDGKKLYESTGPSGRWAPMVSGVFEPFAQHENQEIGSAAKRAQQMASKLIEVDGVSPKDAIKLGMDYLNGEANRIINLERTKLDSKPRGGGGVAVSAPMKARKAFNDEMNRTYMQFKSEKLDEQYQGYNAGIGAISSANTASQYDALNRLIQARSGLTVSDKERAIYDNLAGMWQGAVKKFNLLGGGALPEQYRSQLRTLMNEALRAVVEEKQRRAQAAANFYRAKTRGANPEEVEQDAQAVAEAIMVGASGTAGDPNADLDQ